MGGPSIKILLATSFLLMVAISGCNKDDWFPEPDKNLYPNKIKLLDFFSRKPIEGAIVHFFEDSIKYVGYTITDKEGIASYMDGLSLLSIGDKDHLPTNYDLENTVNVHEVTEDKFEGKVLLILPALLFTIYDDDVGPRYRGRGYKIDFYRTNDPGSDILYTYRSQTVLADYSYFKTWAIKYTWMQISTFFYNWDNSITPDIIVTDKIYVDREIKVRVH